MNRYRSIFAFSAVLICISLDASAQEPVKPKELDALSQASVIQSMNDGKVSATPLPVVTISGNRIFDGYYLQAEKLIFKKDAVLTFSKAALGIRNNLFVVAKEIISEDPAAPGTITYEHAASLPTPAMPGQAPTGAPGSHRRPGGNGSAGATGIAGTTGGAAPNLTIAVLQIGGSGPIIDLRGGNGGDGGQGQKGGDGGNGGSGDNAGQNMFNCNHGAENGYPGGQGGVGGIGGTGGDGGYGGTFTLLAPSDSYAVFLQKLRPMVSAGQLGGPGPGGPGGNGGPGGSGGADARPYCVGSGSQGPTGPTGPGNQTGSKGKSGVDGDIFVGQLNPDQFGKLYKAN
jgi:hypothetical protein